MWPLKLSDITSTTVQRMDSKAKNYIRKWLGLPRCHSDTALIDHNILKLPLKSISLGCKKMKVRHMFELRDSSYPYKTPRLKDTSGMWHKPWSRPSAVLNIERLWVCCSQAELTLDGDPVIRCGPKPQRRKEEALWSRMSYKIKKDTKSEPWANHNKEAGQPGRQWSAGCPRLHTTLFPVPGTFTSGTAQRRPVNFEKCRSRTCSTSSLAVRQLRHRADTDGGRPMLMASQLSPV